MRELQHTIESLVVLCPTETITTDQLPEEIYSAHHQNPLSSIVNIEEMHLKDAVELLETQMIQSALKNSPCAAQAAQKLGIDASTLSKKRKRYGI